MSALKKLKAVEEALNKTFVERSREIHNCILTLVARTTHLLVGPQGTAKSSIIRALSNHIEGANYFQTLVFPEMPADAVLGPIDPKAFQQGEFRRNTKGYLPEANVAFIDEIFRANPSLHIALYNIINEKEFKNGSQLMNVPLIGIFFACNKVQENADPAFLDRFCIKTLVRRVQRMDHIAEIISAWNGHDSALTVEEDAFFSERYHAKDKEKITMEDLNRFTHEAFRVKVPNAILKMSSEIYTKLNQGGHDVSERKIKQAMRIAASEAFVSGDTEVAPGHLLSLVDVLPMIPSESSEVAMTVFMAVDPRLSKIFQAWERSKIDYDAVMSEKSDPSSKKDTWKGKVKAFAKDMEHQLAIVRELAEALPSDEVSGSGSIRTRANEMVAYMSYMKSHAFMLSNLDLVDDVGLKQGKAK